MNDAVEVTGDDVFTAIRELFVRGEWRDLSERLPRTALIEVASDPRALFRLLPKDAPELDDIWWAICGILEREERLPSTLQGHGITRTSFWRTRLPIELDPSGCLWCRAA